MELFSVRGNGYEYHSSWTASGRGRAKRGRRRSAAIPYNQRSIFMANRMVVCKIYGIWYKVFIYKPKTLKYMVLPKFIIRGICGKICGSRAKMCGMLKKRKRVLLCMSGLHIRCAVSVLATTTTTTNNNNNNNIDNNNDIYIYIYRERERDR